MIGDDIAAALPELRAQAESLMTDTCRITYEDRSGEQVWDATTATYVWPTVTVYEGPCRIPRRGTASTSTADAAGQSFQVGEYPFEIPVDGDGYAPGEEVATGQTVTYLTAKFDPSLVGRVFGIVDPAFQSQATKRRFKIKAIVGV